MKVFGQTKRLPAPDVGKGHVEPSLQPLFNIEDSLAVSGQEQLSHAFRSTPHAGSTIETDLFSSMRRFSAMAITSSLVTAAAISSLRKRFIPRKW